ncbi:MAG TPA: hypothetical protein VNQ76_08685 [Planctomicrobium sp.]|nr:hypothetical protein [Planctomicrobium sp.]
MLFARLFGIVPFGIGVTALCFLWMSPWDEFGSPPLFFRVFASFIALGFVLFGLAAFFLKLPSHQNFFDKENFRDGFSRNRKDRFIPPAREGYICLHCNAPLGRHADVSPLGDVKCGHCGKWFNIHGRTG